MLRKIRQEEKRLAAGWTYEPPTFYEVNEYVGSEAAPNGFRAERSFPVTPRVIPRMNGSRETGASTDADPHPLGRRPPSRPRSFPAHTRGRPPLTVLPGPC